MSKSRRHRGRAVAEPDLMRTVRAAMTDPDPLHLLSYVSTLLTAVDPRYQAHPFNRPDPDQSSRDDLTAMFAEVLTPETTALLAAIAALTNDEVLRVRIRRELATRDPVTPDWLGRLDQPRAHRAVRMSHILGDGDNIIMGVRFADDHEATCIVYIDHNMGQLVKDAFVIPEPIDVIVAQYQQINDDPDTSWEELSLPDTRAWIDSAIEMAAMTFPPLETESWPACRPLVEWITRALPTGGTGYQRPQCNTGQLADRFFSSEYGRALDDEEHRGLLDSVLWYATDYGSGDPLRWSDVRVEILLADWLPRKVIASFDYLAQAPELVRAFVRFAHQEAGVRADLTEQTVNAIDAWTPEYLRAIRAPRQSEHSYPPNWFEEQELDDLADEVGGPERLDNLDTRPVPDEPFDWSGIADDVAQRVAETLALTDGCCDALLDVEYRTVCRRVLARIASRTPQAFRRNGRAETAAAGVIWIAGKANDLFDGKSGVRAMDIAKFFGVTSSPSQRGQVMLRAGGFPGGGYGDRLGSPDYLIAARRRRIIERRDEMRQRIAAGDRSSGGRLKR